MDNSTISIGDLDHEERRFVIRAFVRGVRAHDELARLGSSNGRVSYEDVLGALNLSTWSTSEATEVELAWTSEPLCHTRFPRLRAYSVFWCLTTDLQLWIGKTPRKPGEVSSFMTGRTLIGLVMRLYRIRLSSQERTNRVIRFAKRNWMRSLPYILLAAVMIASFTYSYFHRGLVPRTFIQPWIAPASFVCFRYGPRLLGFLAYDVVVGLLLFFGLPYLVWDPSEHLPYGSDTEYPFMAALASAIALGLGVILSRSILYGEDETILEAFQTRFRSLRRTLALMSVTTIAGYGAFLVHSYAVHQVFIEGNRIFVLLIIFGVVALYAMVHKLMER